MIIDTRRGGEALNIRRKQIRNRVTNNRLCDAVYYEGTDRVSLEFKHGKVKEQVDFKDVLQQIKEGMNEDTIESE